MLLGDLLNNWAKLANVSEDQLNDLLQIKEVATAEVNDDVANQLTSQILTKESARHNPDLRNHYFAQFNNGLDTMIERYVDGFDEDSRDEILSQDKTTKKISRLIEKQKELVDKYKSQPAGKDDSKLKETIEGLNTEIRTLKESKEQEIGQLKAQFEQQMLDRDVQGVLSSFNFADKYDREDALFLAKHKLNNAINEKGLQVTSNNGQLSLLTQDGQEFYDNNQKVGFNDFANRVLAENKLLKVTNSEDRTEQPTITTQPKANNAFAQKVAQLAEEAKADLSNTL